jgi:hypothetical protein
MAPARIGVERLTGNTYRVTVSDAGGHTAHTVTVDAAYHQRLTGGSGSPEELVKRSFEFLLEREPKESILASFNLSVIARYFGEYEAEIGRRVKPHGA